MIRKKNATTKRRLKHRLTAKKRKFKYVKAGKNGRKTKKMGGVKNPLYNQATGTYYYANNDDDDEDEDPDVKEQDIDKDKEIITDKESGKLTFDHIGTLKTDKEIQEYISILKETDVKHFIAYMESKCPNCNMNDSFRYRTAQTKLRNINLIREGLSSAINDLKQAIKNNPKDPKIPSLRKNVNDLRSNLYYMVNSMKRTIDTSTTHSSFDLNRIINKQYDSAKKSS